MVKFILLPTFFYSNCLSYYFAFYMLYPMLVKSSKVLWMLEIWRFLSTFGANGFFILELPLGSFILIVIGNLFPLDISLSLETNYSSFLNCSGSFYFLSSWFSRRSSSTPTRRPSRVVISAFLILGISRFSSSIQIFAFYDMIISRFKSYLLRALNKISTP